jgi:hypothetical protein
LPLAGSANVRVKKMDDILSTIGDVMAAPRRGLWGMAGAPFGLSMEDTASGHALLSKLGMDPNSPWTNVLGLGADILGDPLTWGGGLIAKALMGMRGANIATKLDDAVAAEKAAMGAAIPAEAARAAEMAKQTDRFDSFRNFIDPDSLARGDIVKNYGSVEPGLASKLEEMGLGNVTPEGGFSMQAGFRPDIGNPKGMMKAGGVPKGTPPGFLSGVGNRGKHSLTMKPGASLPTEYPSPEELNMLRRALVQEQQALPAGIKELPFQSIHNPVNPAEVFQRVAMERAGQIAPAPMVSMESQLPGIVNEISQLNRRNALLEQLGLAGGIGAGTGFGLGAGSYLGSY